MIALGDILKQYWGAVGRDLAVAGYTWDDVGSQRLPVGQFVSFVNHSPPNSALYHERSEGWTVTDHLLAQEIDALNLLVWLKSADAQKNRNRPAPTMRPGMKRPEPKQQPKSMTVAEYAAKAGIKINFDG